MVKLKILTPYTAPGVTLERFGKFDWVLPYTLNEQGRYEVRVPMENFTPEAGEAAVRAQAELQTRLMDKEFTL